MLAETNARCGSRRAASLRAATSADSWAYVSSCLRGIGQHERPPGYPRGVVHPILGGGVCRAGGGLLAARIDGHEAGQVVPLYEAEEEGGRSLEVTLVPVGERLPKHGPVVPLRRSARARPCPPLSGRRERRSS